MFNTLINNPQSRSPALNWRAEICFLKWFRKQFPAQIYCSEINWIIQKTVWDDKDDKYGKYCKLSISFSFMQSKRRKRKNRKNCAQFEDCKALIYQIQPFETWYMRAPILPTRCSNKHSIVRHRHETSLGFVEVSRLSPNVWKRNKRWQHQQMKVIHLMTKKREKAINFCSLSPKRAILVAIINIFNVSACLKFIYAFENQWG